MTDKTKIDTERELFEAWIHTKAEQEDDQPQPEPHKIHTFSEDELNKYTLSTMFEAWQARASIKPTIPNGLERAVRKMHAAKGRYHTQMTTCDLYDLLSLPNFRPGEVPPVETPAIPPGWQLVPIEPTVEMIAQGEEPWPRNKNNVFGAPVLSTSYAAMLAAAPTPPQGEPS